MSLTKYSTGQMFFSPHHDPLSTFHGLEATRKKNGQLKYDITDIKDLEQSQYGYFGRFATMFYTLSTLDEGEGGETVFPYAFSESMTAEQEDPKYDPFEDHDVGTSSGEELRTSSSNKPGGGKQRVSDVRYCPHSKHLTPPGLSDRSISIQPIEGTAILW